MTPRILYISLLALLLGLNPVPLAKLLSAVAQTLNLSLLDSQLGLLKLICVEAGMKPDSLGTVPLVATVKPEVLPWQQLVLVAYRRHCHQVQSSFPWSNRRVLQYALKSANENGYECC